MQAYGPQPQSVNSISSIKTTYVIIGLNILVYALMLATAGAGEIQGFSTHTLVQSGALYAPLVREGQVWRLLTAMFIHISIVHIAMNMIALFQVGTVMEPHYGRGRFVALYLLSGLGGSGVSLAFHWQNPVVAAGASGAISGLVGAAAVAGHLIGTPQGIRFRNSMLTWAVLILVYGAVIHADNAAHAGGLITGAAIAWLLDRPRAGQYPALTRRPDHGLGIETALLALIVAGGFAFAATSRDSAVSADDLINSGVERAQAGQLDEAIALYRRAAQMEPNEVIAHFDLALALYDKKQYAEAVSEARTATELDPNSKSAFGILADALSAQGQTAEAAKARQRYDQLALTPGP